MWDCVKCGCKAVAASLQQCPMCQREREVPKITVDSGSSNGWAEVEKLAEDVAVAAVEAAVEPARPATAKPAPAPAPAGPPKPAPPPPAAAKPAEPAPDKAE